MGGTLGQLPQQIANGLTLGCVYALIALGYSMVYGILELLNFAHGEIYMIGGFVGWGVLTLLVAKGHLILAAPVTIALMVILSMMACAMLGAVVERSAYRKLRNAPRTAPLLTALGVSIFLQNLVLLIMGARPKFLSTQLVLSPNWLLKLPGANLPAAGALVIVTSVVLMVSLDLMVRRTRLGKAMRATAQDKEAALIVGIPINRTIVIVFIIGSALAGIAGVMVGLYFTSVNFYMGATAGWKAFTAAVVGGIGNLRGAILGGLLMGVLESLATGFISPAYKDAITLSVLIVVLIVRPAGLLGEELSQKA